MGESCAIIPKIRNKEGKLVDSKLFKDLSSVTDRNTAVRCYTITKNPKFIDNLLPGLKQDQNGEPLISELFKKMSLGKLISETQVLERLNRRIGAYKNGKNEIALYPDNEKNFSELKDKALSFNRNSDFNKDYVALVHRSYEDGKPKLSIRVSKRNRQNSSEASMMDNNESLNGKLRGILERNNIMIGTLNELERRLGVNGVTDFSKAREAAKGMIELIRLAKGERGEQALPEEFSHFAIAALREDPIVSRLVNMLENNDDLVREVLGEDYEGYYDQYEGNNTRLAREAAGKLLARNLAREHNNEGLEEKPYKNLLRRVIDAVKRFFSKFDETEISRAMLEADKESRIIAQGILDGRYEGSYDLTGLEDVDAGQLFQLTQERVKRDKKILQEIIDNETKRLKIYEKRSGNQAFGKKQRELLNDLEKKLFANLEIEGIYSFIDRGLEELDKVSKRLADVFNDPYMSINEKAGVLRDVRNYIFSYKHIEETVREALLDEELESDNRYGDRMRVVLDNLNILINDLYERQKKVAMPLFVSFIKPFMGEAIEVPFGKFKGRRYTVEDLVKVADQDISFFDRWLDSMADSSDYMNKIFDQAVKKAKNEARLNTLDVKRELYKIDAEAKEAGISNWDWIYERDSDGNLTGNYIMEINWGEYKKRRSEMYARLRSKYGKFPVGKQYEEYKRERNTWYMENTELDSSGERIPKMSVYENKTFTRMSDKQKELYARIMEIKSKFDAYLPTGYTTLNNAVKIRKDLVERLKSAQKNPLKEIWESLKDQVIRRSDDTGFGDKAILKDFEGNQVQTLPIYFTKFNENENPNDMSTDLISTMIAYASMANDFHEMSKIIDILEVGRDLMRERKVTDTSSGRKLMEKLKIGNRTVESVLIKNRSLFLDRLNDFFTMQVYGRYMADETLGRIDLGKLGNFANRITSIHSLGLNMLAGISNILTGKVMMRIESFCKEFFSESNTLRADRNYAKALPEFLAQVGSRVQTSKLALFDELFDVLQEYDKEITNQEFQRSRFSRLFSMSSLFILNNAGEHWMQNRTALALADAYKMMDERGNECSLWDALEVVYTDPSNPEKGAKLQIRKGYKKADGTEFTRQDIYRFSRKCAAINQRMHGIYNEIDKNAIQRLALGRMGIMFRKWIRPSINRRFKSASYNMDLEAWTEGYYRTTNRFLLTLAKDLKEGQFQLAAHWDELTDTEKANIRRTMTEVGHLLAIILLLGLLDWPDDKDRPWVSRMAEYQLHRLYTEVGALTPYGVQMPKEALKIVKSPMAGINTLEQLLNCTKILNPYNYESVGEDDAVLQSGRFKGHSRAYKALMESPFIPMYSTVMRGLHPEDMMSYFNQK